MSLQRPTEPCSLFTDTFTGWSHLDLSSWNGCALSLQEPQDSEHLATASMREMGVTYAPLPGSPTDP